MISGSSESARLPALVGLDGLEPSTSRLSAECSNQLSYRPVLRGYSVRVRRMTASLHPDSFSCSVSVAVEENGGDEGNRTLDPLLAGQVLSQLSYTPVPSYSRSAGSSFPASRISFFLPFSSSIRAMKTEQQVLYLTLFTTLLFVVIFLFLYLDL